MAAGGRERGRVEGKAREGWRDREKRKQAAGLPHQASRAYEHSDLEERPFRRAEHCQWEDQQQAADCDGPPTDTDGRHPEPASTNPLRHSRIDESLAAQSVPSAHPCALRTSMDALPIPHRRLTEKRATVRRCARAFAYVTTFMHASERARARRPRRPLRCCNAPCRMLNVAPCTSHGRII